MAPHKKPTPHFHLRHVAVYVDEPDHGLYYWVIIESVGDATVWTDHIVSEEPFTSWQAAWDAGNRELLKLVADPAVGPLAPGEDENASPVGTNST